jgi:hypothetical protein
VRGHGLKNVIARQKSQEQKSLMIQVQSLAQVRARVQARVQAQVQVVLQIATKFINKLS